MKEDFWPGVIPIKLILSFSIRETTKSDARAP